MTDRRIKEKKEDRSEEAILDIKLLRNLGCLKTRSDMEYSSPAFNFPESVCSKNRTELPPKF